MKEPALARAASSSDLGEHPAIQPSSGHEPPVEETKVIEPPKDGEKPKLSEKAKAKNAANQDVLDLMAKQKEARFTNKLQHPFYSNVVFSKLGMTLR